VDPNHQLISLNFNSTAKPGGGFTGTHFGLLEARLTELQAKCQSLEGQLLAVKETHKQEKLSLLEKLSQIEQNYQKYAFFYTKYLEERVVYEEAMQQSAKEAVVLQDIIKTLLTLISDSPHPVIPPTHPVFSQLTATIKCDSGNDQHELSALLDKLQHPSSFKLHSRHFA
jgi:hypothetical protein